MVSLAKYIDSDQSGVFFTEKMDYLSVGRVSGLPNMDLMDLESYFTTKVTRNPPPRKSTFQPVPKLESVVLRPPTVSSRPDRTISKSRLASKDYEDRSFAPEKPSDFSSVEKKSLAQELSFIRREYEQQKKPKKYYRRPPDPAEVKELLSEHKLIGYDKPALPKNYFKIHRIVLQRQKSEMPEILEDPYEEKRQVKGINKGYIDYLKQK